MLTYQLRKNGHEVLSFVENNHGEGSGNFAEQKDGTPIPFEEWVWSDMGKQSFDYDTKGATESDLVIYISPSGTDAWAEVGAAWASNVPIFGLHAKGEQSGLMRRMVRGWFDDWHDLLEHVEVMDKASKI